MISRPLGKILAALALAAGLVGCDWLLGETYIVRHIDTTSLPARTAQERDGFLSTIDALGRKRGMTPVACGHASAEGVGCRTYRSAEGVFLAGSIDAKSNEFEISVYEWNARRRDPVALDIEAELLAALRARFGERVVKREPPPRASRSPFPAEVACTMEAKACPDGSYVGREPANNCAFRPCPGG